MTIENVPFVAKTLEGDRKEEVISVKLNKEERLELEEAKRAIHQEKDSTALKQLARLGLEVIRDKKIVAFLDIIQGNDRRNKRIGIQVYE